LAWISADDSDLQFHVESNQAWTVLSFYVNRNAVANSLKAKIDAVFIDLECPHFQTVNTNGQSRLPDDHSTVSGVNADPQACLQEHENRACCPGLRQTGDWIGNRCLTRTTLEPAEQFG
jgi:hypothetical protein